MLNISSKIRFYVEVASKRLVTFSDVMFARSHQGPLLRGDLVAYAESEYPKKRFPTMWVTIPKDVRRPIIWDGRLLNGRDVAELAKSQITDAHVVDALIQSGMQALKLFIFASLLVGAALTWFGATSGSAGFHTPYPQWAGDHGAWMPILFWYLLWPLERGWSMVAGAFGIGLPLLLLIPAFWASAFSIAMSRLWANVSGPLRVPTRDSKVFWKSNIATREHEYETYCREVANSITWLKDAPVLSLGKATGIFRSRGVTKAPKRGQVIGLDGVSARQHLIVFGRTGARKTTLVMHPLFNRFMQSDWGPGHRMGSYVTDGKGTLWRDLLPMVNHRKDVRVIGIDEGQYGVNLIEGMTPGEIMNAFTSVCGSVTGMGGDNQYWVNSAGLLLFNAARIAAGLELDPETVDGWITRRNVRPYSLQGIYLIAAEQQVTTESLARLIEIGHALGNASSEENKIYLKAIEALEYMDGTFLPMLNSTGGTAASIIGTINATIGQLRGHDEISRNFCSGTYEHSIDVDYALKGGICMIAISASQHGIAGKIISTWLKTRLYMLARRRMQTHAEECKTTSCALFADEFQDLAVVGNNDGNDDGSAWATLRESGLFLVAATQNLAALQAIMGHEVAEKFLSLMSTKIIMTTDEKATVEWAIKAAGELPRGWEPDQNFWATQAVREIALGMYGPTSFGLRGLDGMLPYYFSAGTSQGKAHNAWYLAGLLSNRSAGALDPVGTPPSTDHSGTIVSIAQRDEDKNREAMIGGLTRLPVLEQHELKLGMGHAFVMWQRAGGERMDVIDLNILPDAA
ncbi:type IV secretory system conjugative DNA transfer family protein [Rhizobium laguerreae]|uniref:type IV secretory system conjugative DNA transfer family protein n=1 Tax=Rhizobium laguerreae TaxID=1076926 RepID=UPI001C8FE5EF|nr:type IV secretion system DNA-binding domain-containing protein [Rhizobium laguerreae]MBY3314754.1 type IV secretion system DNA-binding domain-containing protein [Rhizobium laguerreae]